MNRNLRDIRCAKPMTGQFTGMFRIRAGDYRAIHELDRDNRKIFIDSVGHRSEVYRRR
jgi:mRNA interferase RelE/StbE